MTSDESKSINEKIESKRNLIESVRNRFLAIFESTDSDLYYAVDVEKVRLSDWKVWRFLAPVDYDPELALQNLVKATKWRKLMEMNSRREADLPKEFYQIGGIFSLNSDRDGLPIVYMRVKANLKIGKLVKFVNQLIACVIDQVDDRANERGFVIVLDMSGAGLRNVDLELLKYLISILTHFYPEGMQYMLVYNLPWILRSFWNLVRMWLSPKQQNLVKFANGDQIQKYIDTNSLPKYLGGLCGYNFAESPAGCKSVLEIGNQYGFTDDEIRQYYKMFESIIKENQQIIS